MAHRLAALARLLPHRTAGLHVCPVCRGDFVNPTGWYEAGERRWVVGLRCGACGHVRAKTVGPLAARRLDEALDAGYYAISRAADRAEAERMEAFVATFTTALERDLIGADDFGGARAAR